MSAYYGCWRAEQMTSDTVRITNINSGEQYMKELKPGKRRRLTEQELKGVIKLWLKKRRVH